MSILDSFRRPAFDDFANDGSDVDPEDDFLDHAFRIDEVRTATIGGLGLVSATPRGGRIDLADILKDAARDNVKLTWEPGWQTRGAPVMLPAGILVHWTAGRPSPKNPAPSRAICRDGRPASKGVTAVPGPLVHFLIGLDGMIYAIASGRANHAGMGDKALLGMLGKPLPSPRINPGKDNGGSGGSLYGIEVENRGGGDPFSPAQVIALTWLVRAICAHEKWDARERVVCHDEWTTRKVDITKPGNPWAHPVDFRNAFHVALPVVSRFLWLLQGVDPQFNGWIVQPTGPDSAVHLSPVQVDALKAAGWNVQVHRAVPKHLS